MRPISWGWFLICSLSACGRQSLAPEDIPNIEGIWTLSESVDGSGTSCQLIGTLDVRQDGESFVGQYTRTSQCTTGLNPTVGAPQIGSTSTGRVGRETVDFRITDCDYHGLITDLSITDHITGSIICTKVVIGGISTQAGNWQASKIAD